MKLSGNTILVTGGSTGIGLAFAKKFVALGNSVVITGRSQAKLDAALKEEPKLVAIRNDASDAKATSALAADVTARFPNVNVLFNNAGILRYLNLAQGEADLTALTSEIDINLSGPIRLVSAFIDTLRKNKGTIVNVSSGLAFVPLTAAPIYSATKAAMHAYTITLRQQLRDQGVEVIELMPPSVKTDLATIPKDVKVLTTDELVAATLKDLGRGVEEITPGQAGQLRFMSRVAPGFIRGMLEKGSRPLIPGRQA